VKLHPSDKIPPQKRATLFKLACEEFAEQGFKQASLNRIISGAGMSKSSFYHYFDNKADLFSRALEQAFMPFLQALESFDVSTITAQSYWPFLKTMTQEMNQVANDSPELIVVGRMFYRSQDNPEERALTQYLIDLSTRWLVDLIHRGQELGLVRSDLPEGLLIDLLMSLNMTMDRWAINNWEGLSEAERVSLWEQGFDLFVRVLHSGEGHP